MIKDLIEIFEKHLRMSADDAIVAAVFALAGFTIDAHLFPAGMPPGTVTTLSASGGFLLSKAFKGTKWYQDRVFRQFDKLVAGGHMTEEEAKEYKRKLTSLWVKDSHGISVEDDSATKP